jgi:hypothetical protein
MAEEKGHDDGQAWEEGDEVFGMIGGKAKDGMHRHRK